MHPTISNISQWGFVSGRISALEEGFLSREFFLTMAGQENTDDILRNFQDTFIGDYFATGITSDELDSVFDRCFYEMALSLRNDCPSSIPADIFLLKYDYLNLKAALTGKSTFLFTTELLPQERLSSITQGNYSELPQPLKESVTPATFEAFQIDAGIIDIALDGSYLRHLLLLANALKSSMIKRYITEMVLAYIVIILWRAVNQGIALKRYQQYLLPLGDFTGVVNDLIGANNQDAWQTIIGDKIGDLFNESLGSQTDDQISIFNLKVSNYLGRIAREGRYQTAGPERVFAFLSGFFTEMQNLKLVFTGRLNRIDQGIIKERLRDCYV